MTEYLAALLPILSLFVYAILFSIECGAALFMLEPELVGGEKVVRSYINPAWETTNVFLIFALLWLIAFFPGAVPIWGHALITPFLIFLAIMGIRSIGMLYVFYKEGRSHAMKLMLLASSFAAPMALAGGIAPFFMTGGIQLLPAISLACLAFASALFIACSFFNYLASRNPGRRKESLTLLVRFSMIIFLAVLFLSLSLLTDTVPHIAPGIASSLIVIFVLAILNLISIFTDGKRYAAGRFLLAIALFGSAFFGIMLSQLPYVIYPTMTIFSAFTDPASAKIMLTALCVAGAIVLPSLWLLYHLVLSKKK